jgi:hypothetical protein
MSNAVQDILAKIDRLDEAEQEELRAALKLRAYAIWEKSAEAERRRSADEGINEEDIQRAVNEVRYGKQPS